MRRASLAVPLALALIAAVPAVLEGQGPLRSDRFATIHRANGLARDAALPRTARAGTEEAVTLGLFLGGSLGLVIGAALTKVVDSLVADFIMPIVGAIVFSTW